MTDTFERIETVQGNRSHRQPLASRRRRAVRLWPIAALVRRGHRLRLAEASRPKPLPNATGSTRRRVRETMPLHRSCRTAAASRAFEWANANIAIDRRPFMYHEPGRRNIAVNHR